MKKIIILNGPSKQDDLLMAYLRILFPECHIQVQTNGKELREGASVIPKVVFEKRIKK